MYLSETDARHSFATTFVPPATGVCNAQMTFVFIGILIITANQVGIAMVFSTSRSSAPWGYQIAESAPGDSYKVATMLTIQVAVNTVLEITMIHPDALAVLDGQVVVAVNIVGTSSFKGEVSQYDVLTVLQHQDTALGLLVRMVGVTERTLRQSVDGLVAGLTDGYLSVDIDSSFDVDGLLA